VTGDACPYPTHRATDWRLSPDAPVRCGVCSPPADPRLAQPAIAEPVTLAECEAVIARGIATFLEVGQALLRIRDERLYRPRFDTFEAYCRERWRFTDRRARHLMGAAEVMAALPSGTTVPANEAVARELAPLRAEPDAMREVWAETVERHGETPTAAAVHEVVAERRNGYRPERTARSVRGASEAFSDVLAVVVLGRNPRILAWQPLPQTDDLADLDLGHARRHLAEREAKLRRTAVPSNRCRCERPLIGPEDTCARCGKERRA
jgi:hypothetical protein